MANDFNQAAFLELAQAIAAAMGEGWKSIGPKHDDVKGSAYITNGDLEIYISDNDYFYARANEKNKLTCSASWPKTYHDLYLNDQYKVNPIMSTKTKTPAQIAADIHRRLIPSIVTANAEYQRLMGLRIERSNKMLDVIGRYDAINNDSVTVTPGKLNASGLPDEGKLSVRGANESNFFYARLSTQALLVENGYMSHDVGVLLVKLLLAEKAGKLDQVVIPD